MKIANIRLTLRTLDNLDVSVLSIPSLGTMIKLRNSLLETSKEFSETQDALMASYGIKVVGEIYDWSNHEKETEVRDKVAELYDTEFEPSTKLLNFMDHNEYLKSAGKNCTLSEISELQKILVKN